jgi:hypothetical protein
MYIPYISRPNLLSVCSNFFFQATPQWVDFHYHGDNETQHTTMYVQRDYELKNRKKKQEGGSPPTASVFNGDLLQDKLFYSQIAKTRSTEAISQITITKTNILCSRLVLIVVNICLYVSRALSQFESMLTYHVHSFSAFNI